MLAIKLGGKSIPLLFTVAAWGKIEEEICRIENLDDRIKGEKQDETTLALIQILGNAGMENAGEEPGLTLEWVAENINRRLMAGYRMMCMAALGKGLKMEGAEKKEKDLSLLKVMKARGQGFMTYRMVLGYGLIAGLGYAETRRMEPGIVCDLFKARQEYDAAHAGIRI